MNNFVVRINNTFGNDGKSIHLLPILDFFWISGDYCISIGWLLFEIEIWFGNGQLDSV